MIAASTAELTLRMLVSLALVSGLLWLATRFASKRLRRGSAAAVLDVRNRHQLTKSSAIAVVRAGSRHFLVGVNDHAITLLAEGDDLVVSAEVGGHDQASLAVEPATAGPAAADQNATRSGPKRPRAILDMRKSGARKRRSGAASASSGIGVIEALRERSVRR